MGTGNCNNALGSFSQIWNTDGNDNVSIGYRTLANNIHGNRNIGIGNNAGKNIKKDNNICIDNYGHHEDDSTIRIGTHQKRCFIAGIYNNDVKGEVVCIDSQGQLGTINLLQIIHDLQQQIIELQKQIFSKDNT